MQFFTFGVKLIKENLEMLMVMLVLVIPIVLLCSFTNNTLIVKQTKIFFMECMKDKKTILIHKVLSNFYLHNIKKLVCGYPFPVQFVIK